MQKCNFFLLGSFPDKAFVFLNNIISEARICRQGWFRKTCTFVCFISRKQKPKQQKRLWGTKFKVTCKHLANLEAEKGPKKSLTLFMQAPFTNRAIRNVAIWSIITWLVACAGKMKHVTSD